MKTKITILNGKGEARPLCAEGEEKKVLKRTKENKTHTRKHKETATYRTTAKQTNSDKTDKESFKAARRKAEVPMDLEKL